jgi:GTPase SAR1 family protein
MDILKKFSRQVSIVFRGVGAGGGESADKLFETPESSDDSETESGSVDSQKESDEEFGEPVVPALERSGGYWLGRQFFPYDIPSIRILYIHHDSDFGFNEQYSQSDILPLLWHFSQGHFTCLWSLELEDSNIGDEAAKLIAQGLKVVRALGELDLKFNGVGDSGAIALGKGLKVNTTLLSLHLYGNRIGDAGVVGLCKGLKVNTRLQTLDLKSNPFGDVGALGLVDALKVNSSLQELHLRLDGNQHISFPVTASLMRGCPNILTLRFERSDWKECFQSDSWIGLAVPPDDLVALGHVFKFVKSYGECVPVRNNFISFDSEEIRLKFNRKLVTADLIPFLECFISGKFTRLRVLNLGGNEIDDEGAMLISEALEDNTSLLELRLQGNNVGDAGAAALGHVLKTNSCLQGLYLERNTVRDAGAEGLAEMLKVNSSLQKLFLNDQKGGEFSILVSSSLMRVCQNLQFFNFNCISWKACIASDDWVRANLPIPPSEVVARGTRSVFEFVKAFLQGGSFVSNSCRVMVVGPQMVGKTSIVNALKHKLSPPIAHDFRTAYLEVSQLVTEDGVDLRIWDFAGQEVYYLSHSVHFTQRCLYILTWTRPQTAQHAGALSPPQTLEHLVGDLRLWLQMLAQHIPNANVLLVGTRDDGSAEYQSMRAQVEAAVDAEILQLNCRVIPECEALLCMAKQNQVRVDACKECWKTSGIGRQYDGGMPDKSDRLKHLKQEMKWWWHTSEDAGLEKWQQRTAREVAAGLRRVFMILQRHELICNAKLQRVARDQSFTIDCLDGRGVARLQSQLGVLCKSHVPQMGEMLPSLWLLALKALQVQGNSEPMPKLVAIERIRRAVPDLSSPEERSDHSIWCILLFWADLGRIFIYKDFVLINPLHLVNLMKPLLHHDPPFLLSDACPDEYKALLLPSCHEISSRSNCLLYLKKLKYYALLDRRLLALLPDWTESLEFHEAMLKFLADCHLICFTGHISDARSDILVTARSRDLPSFDTDYFFAPWLGDHDEELKMRHVRLRFSAVIGSRDAYRVLFLASRHHVGIISRLQAFIQKAQPRKISLVVRAAKECLFICRGDSILTNTTQACCAVRVLPSCNDVRPDDLSLSAFLMNDGPLSRENDRRACAVIVSSNDFALLTFMVSCVEDTLKNWSICVDCQCWVQGPSDNQPFIKFDCLSGDTVNDAVDDAVDAVDDACSLPLSAVLTGNPWNEVVPGVRMRDIFPFQRRCAMFLSYALMDSENTGTRCACDSIRNGFQQAALCSVWMNRADAPRDQPRKMLMRKALQAANVYIICLTPLYFTWPDCLIELNDILTLVEKFPVNKRLIVMPLHPAMTASGRRHIRQTKYVLLPDFQNVSIIRKHCLSCNALNLLERLSNYDPGLDDHFAVRCLDTEPWLSTLPSKQLNVQWNGIEGILDLCRNIVNKEGRDLPSLLICADDEPLSGVPFLDDLTSASVPPSLRALDYDAAQSSMVESIDDHFGLIFRLFSKRDAIYLATFGVSSDQLCELVQNSSLSLQKFPYYLKRLLENVNYTSAEGAFGGGGSEDLGSLLDWVMSPPETPVTRKVLCRVEGTDDMLLLHSIFNLMLPSSSLQRLPQRLPGSWKSFSYSCPSAVLKIKDCTKLVETKVSSAKGPKASSQKEIKVNFSSLGLIRSLQSIAQVKRFQLCWLDIDDQDLKAFETRPKQRPERESSLLTWRWGRAIENYLLPVTAPVSMFMRDFKLTSDLTSEVFVTISRHFFPIVSESESNKGKLCGHVDFKWNDLIGPGWNSWSSLLQSADVCFHMDPDAKHAAESLRNFSIDLLGIVALLVSQHNDVYISDGTRADEWLLHLTSVHGHVRKGRYNISKGKVDWKKACTAMLSLHVDKPSTPLNRGDADDSALWFNLPAVCSFLSSVCSCSWLDEEVEIPNDALKVKSAAACVLRLVQHALCVLLLGCDPAFHAPQVTLFASADCTFFLPLVGEKSVARCFTCGRLDTEHTLLKPDPPSETFLVELCRVGSVGWHSHKYMDSIHGRTHLGVTFNEKELPTSLQLYEQHVRSILDDDSTGCHCCRDAASFAPPLLDVTVYVITDGKVREGRMQPLLGQRRSEFTRLCSHVELLIGAPASSACAVGTIPSFLGASGGKAASKAGGGGGAVAGTRPLLDLSVMTAQDVATAIGRLGPPYEAYERPIVDNRVNGKMVARLLAKDEAQALEWLKDLGVSSSVHRDSILLEFQSWSSP